MACPTQHAGQCACGLAQVSKVQVSEVQVGELQVSEVQVGKAHAALTMRVSEALAAQHGGQ